MNNNFSIYQIAPRTFTPDGTLGAATEMLPFVKETGFDVVYLCPVFTEDDDPDRISWSRRQILSGCENPKNPYKIKDYFNVDSEFGTLSDLRHFIDTAHSLGLKVWLDLVYLHCGAGAVFIKDHPDWVECDEFGKPIVAERWPFARINYKNDGVREYLWSNMEFYVREFGVDGYRCDASDNVPLDFWREGKRRITEINPNIIMLNEGENPEYIKEVFDYNYWNVDYREMLKSPYPGRYLKERTDFAKRGGSFGRYISHVENHDTATDFERFDAGHSLRQANMVFFIMYTGEDLPFVWNGNEIADRSENNMFSNRFYGKRSAINWSGAFRPDGICRRKLIKALNDMRHTVSCIGAGDKTYIEAGDKIVCYTRDDGVSRALFAANAGDTAEEVNLDMLTGKEEILLQSGAAFRQGRISLEKYGFIAILLK